MWYMVIVVVMAVGSGSGSGCHRYILTSDPMRKRFPVSRPTQNWLRQEVFVVPAAKTIAHHE